MGWIFQDIAVGPHGALREDAALPALWPWRWEGWVMVATGLASAALGLVVMLGWWTQTRSLVEVIPHTAIMQFNTAVCFLACGIGLITASSGQLLATRIAAGVGALISALVLLQYSTGINLGIDGLLADPFVKDAISPPGRMSWPTALSFLFSCNVLLVITSHRNRGTAALLGGVLATLVVAIAGVTLITYSGLLEAGITMLLRGMALQTAMGMLTVGIGCLIFALAAQSSRQELLSNWVGIPVFLIGCAVTFMTWTALTTQERSTQLQRDALVAEFAEQKLQDWANAEFWYLHHFAMSWRRGGASTELALQETRSQNGKVLYGLLSMIWLSEDGRDIRINKIDTEPFAPPIDEALVMRMLKGWGGETDERNPVISTMLSRAYPVPTFQLILNNRSVVEKWGTFIASFDSSRVFPLIFRNVEALGYDVQVLAGDALLYESRDGELDSSDQVTHSVTVRDGVPFGLAIRIWPSTAAEAPGFSALRVAILIGGIFLSLLLALSAHLGVNSNRERRRTEVVNTRLEKEKEERRVAEEWMRQIVESAPNALVIVNELGRIQMVNNRVVEWFGYSREELLDQPVEMLVPEHLRKDHVAIRAGYMARPNLRPMGAGLDISARRSNGSLMSVDVSLSPVRTVDGVRIIASIVDITERRRTEQELRRAMAELAAVNRELEAFSYSVSHDLRQPLRAMLSYGQILIEDYTGALDDEGKRYIERIQAAGMRMGQLITDLLSLARVTQFNLSREPVSLSALAESICDNLREIYPDLQARIDIEPDMTVQADRQLMRLALENLLSNAWKFSTKEQQAHIQVGTRISKGDTIYCVRDNGAGFDMTFAEKLFTPFQRLHTTDEFPGSGIGLATVQRIIHRHGGHIWAESSPDKGATFCFTLGRAISADENNER